VRFSVLALDYDGTIARDGALDPNVRQAIAEARARGIIVVLVTGRILSDLMRAAGDLQFADAVVAENGAVLAFPNGQLRLLGQLPPPVFIQELRKRGMEVTVGQCIVEAEADLGQRILEVIRSLELPLVLLFNRGRLMVLPQAISKATGLHEALRTLRLSSHNTIAIGDGENDHDLLAACELGVAVSWGSQALQNVADEVMRGVGPSAVAPYIREAVQTMRLPSDRIGRRHLVLGTEENGNPLKLALRGRNLLVTGGTGSGKSWATGLLCEQLILQGYCVWIIDPEGEYAGLKSLPGVMVLGGKKTPPSLQDLVEVARYPDLSVVVDLSHLDHKEKLNYLNLLLPTLASLRRSTGLPHRIVVDEAHYFLHEPTVAKLLDLDLGAYILVTYRPSGLHASLQRAIEGVIAKRLTDPDELRALIRMFGNKNAESEWKSTLKSLTASQAALLPGIEEAEGKLKRFEMQARLTPHVRHRTKYFDVPMPEADGFLFTRNGKPVAGPARTLKDFVWLLASSSPEVIEGHARRGDFSHWIRNVLRDNLLAAIVSEVEHQHQLGKIHDLQSELAKRIQERFDLPPQFCPPVCKIETGDALHPRECKAETEHACSSSIG
jgi:hydroxymethylpyrimidine pyrophosphatase-like HAD family hydrolase